MSNILLLSQAKIKFKSYASVDINEYNQVAFGK